MTQLKRGLAWVAQGKPRKDMEADLNLSTAQCQRLLDYMRAKGYIRPVYMLTDPGEERLRKVPKTDQRLLDYQRRYYRRKKPMTADQVVDCARRMAMPNSVFALGDMHGLMS